jgi:hypothetical protein
VAQSITKFDRRISAVLSDGPYYRVFFFDAIYAESISRHKGIYKPLRGAHATNSIGMAALLENLPQDINNICKNWRVEKEPLFSLTCIYYFAVSHIWD